MHAGLAGIRRAAADIEPWLGAFVNLRMPGYTSEPEVVTAGAGVFTAVDWTRLRSDGSTAFGTTGSEFDNDANYLRYIFGLEGMNVVGAIALAKVFDFTAYRSVFEIGCGAMAQAYVLRQLFPHLRYVATDLDPYVIERCEHLSVLGGIEKRALDVLAIDDGTVPFDTADLLMSWGMEYALDDVQFVRLLKLAKRANVPYLMCSATIVGLLKYAIFLSKYPRNARLRAKRQLRVTGWHRSLGKFRRLAREAGMTARPLGRFGEHFCILFAPSETVARTRT